jgi:16S rRNA (guanine527-N7)-methyltransferase
VKHPDNQLRTIASQARELVAEHLRDAGREGDGSLLNERFLDRIEKLSGLIAHWGALTNLTSQPRNPSELAFHIIDSLAPIFLEQEGLETAFCAESEVLDLGSGAGFPGLVLAATSPAKFTLVESRRKRASFLSVAATELGLSNVAVELRQIKAGDFQGRFDAVLARAFGPALQFHSIAHAALKRRAVAILYANRGQESDFGGAIDSARFRILTYSIPRNNRTVERLLMVWHT